MLSIALTGNVAAGKTAVIEIWREAGAQVVVADELARRVVEPGSDGLAAVVEAFGSGVLASDGSLDRAALRDRVFRAPMERKKLEAILHPRIQALRDAWMREQEAAGHRLVVAEIPLLFEVGLQDEFDVVVVVDAPEGERLRRLMENRGLTEATARSIMDAQMAGAEKRDLADYVLENGGSREELDERALALLDLLRARSRKAGEGEA